MVLFFPSMVHQSEARFGAQTQHKPVTDPYKLPKRKCDRSITGQAPSQGCDIVLSPPTIFKDPFRRGKNIWIYYDIDRLESIPNNYEKYYRAAKNFNHPDVADGPWDSFEQEYTALQKDGWPIQGFLGAQEPYYCGIGTNNAFERDIVDAHYKACRFGYDNRRFEDTKGRLCDHARSFGLKMKVEETSIGYLTNETKRTEGKEWLVFNCMVDLPHMGKKRNRRQISEFLGLAKELIHTCATNRGLIIFGEDGERMKNQSGSSYSSSFSEACLRHYRALCESMELNFSNYLIEPRMAIFVVPYLMLLPSYQFLLQGVSLMQASKNYVNNSKVIPDQASYII